MWTEDTIPPAEWALWATLLFCRHTSQHAITCTLIGALLVGATRLQGQSLDTIKVGPQEHVITTRSPLRSATAVAYPYEASYEPSAGEVPRMSFVCIQPTQQVAMYVTYARDFSHPDSVAVVLAPLGAFHFGGARYHRNDTVVRDSQLPQTWELILQAAREAEIERMIIVPSLGLESFLVFKASTMTRLTERFLDTCKREVWRR